MSQEALLVRWASASLLVASMQGCANENATSTAGVGGGTQAAATGGDSNNPASGGVNGLGGAGNGSTLGGNSAIGGASTAGGTTGPSSCGAAQKAYTLSSFKLDSALAPTVSTSGWGAPRGALPVALDPSNGKLYIGFTKTSGSSSSANIVAEDGNAGSVLSIPNAVGGSIAVTSDGFGIILFEPVAESSRKWAAVARLNRDGSVKYQTDLFRSANLTDAGTKGEPSTNRLVYTTDGQLFAYFEHSEMIDGVRHFGGYLAAVNASGTQALLSGWFGSHNLDQRAIADGNKAVTLGLGDAYPKGIIFAAVTATDKPRASSAYLLAANGVGTTNGQLGGIADTGATYLIPFVTNQTLAQNFDAGAWPNTDAAKSAQIEAAAAHGTDVGLLTVQKGTTIASTGLTATFIDVKRGVEMAGDTAISSLKIARYGTGFYLLVWKESLGTGRTATSKFFTMVIDASGAVCQPKAELAADYQVMPGDDIVTRPDGRISWTNYQGNQINVVTLTP